MKVSAIASILLGVLPYIVKAVTLPVERSDVFDEKPAVNHGSQAPSYPLNGIHEARAVNHGSQAPSYPPYGIHERTADGIKGNSLFRRKDDDDWLLVLFTDENSSGTQCGGTYEQETGGKSACLRIPSNKWCAEMSVNTGVCTFKFKSESCGGATQKTVTAKAGTDVHGVSLSSKVQFVQINCN
ncbi:hypothetical protein HJFPF1_02204 [Paramyrothecium foliicola]|nr:hypothetical protein HJFPF1_02204 [Paramyrothecium foliicola]